MRTIYDDVLKRYEPLRAAIDVVVGPVLAGQSDDATAESQAAEAERGERWRQITRKSSSRPMTWASFGNRSAVEQLQEHIAAARAEGGPVGHVLMHGQAGVGKTTLARLVAQSMGGLFVETVASALGGVVDLIRILHRLNQGFETTGQPSVLFLDEAHRLAPGNAPRAPGSPRASSPRALDEEALYPLLEDWTFFHAGELGEILAFAAARKLKDDTLQIGSGHHRVKAAIKAGLKEADIFVSRDWDDATMLAVYATENATQRGNVSAAVMGSVAGAVRWIVKQVMVGNQVGEIFPTSQEFTQARTALSSEDGLGRSSVERFFAVRKIPISEKEIRVALSSLKESGDYKRIITEVAEEVEQENREAAKALETADVASSTATPSSPASCQHRHGALHAGRTRPDPRRRRRALGVAPRDGRGRGAGEVLQAESCRGAEAPATRAPHSRGPLPVPSASSRSSRRPGISPQLWRDPRGPAKLLPAISSEAMGSAMN